MDSFTDQILLTPFSNLLPTKAAQINLHSEYIKRQVSLPSQTNSNALIPKSQ